MFPRFHAAVVVATRDQCADHVWWMVPDPNDASQFHLWSTSVDKTCLVGCNSSVAGSQACFAVNVLQL